MNWKAFWVPFRENLGIAYLFAPTLFIKKMPKRDNNTGCGLAVECSGVQGCVFVTLRIQLQEFEVFDVLGKLVYCIVTGCIVPGADGQGTESLAECCCGES